MRTLPRRLNHARLERLVRVEVQGQPRVGEEEVQSSEVEQVVPAHLAGKCLDCCVHTTGCHSRTVMLALHRAG